MASDTTTAVVVAGGGARRMGGVDKLALPVGDRSVLDRVLAAARPRCQTLLVVGPHRPTVVEGVTFVGEEPPGGGPVPAVAAGLGAAGAGRSAIVVVLAGDLPLLAATDVDRLVDALADPSVDAVAALDHRGRPHPLLAAYRADVLGARLAALGPATHGARAAQLLPPSVRTIDLGEQATLNVNDPGDLEKARAYARARAT